MRPSVSSILLFADSIDLLEPPYLGRRPCRHRPSRSLEWPIRFGTIGFLAEPRQATTLSVMYDSGDIGPALPRLRRSRGLTQSEVAVRTKQAVQSVSRIEQPGSNPKVASVQRLLHGIGASFSDLQAELVAMIAEEDADAKLKQPSREALMLRRLAASEDSPFLRALTGMLDDFERRLRTLERGPAPRKP